MKRVALALLAMVASGGACSPRGLPPEGQIRLFVDTDAILPPAPGESDGGQMPLFDRLRIELFAPGASEPCATCTREFGIDQRTVFESHASVGIAPPPGEAGHRARVRLYRSGGADAVEPRATSTLEAVVALPVVASEGIIDAHVVLRTDDLGSPQGTLDAPRDALRGPADGQLAGSWAASYRRGCAGAPAAGEVCVPGGAFWLGDPTFIVPSEHLVAVAPFYLDATEVTVASLRAGGFSTPLVHGAGETHFCTFTATPGAFEDRPVSCVPRPIARGYCAARGGDLPSEAQWELAASGRRSARYVWGEDAPECAFSVYARYDLTGNMPALARCAKLGVGVALPGSGTRDRLELDGGAIVDLMGNLAEWARDDWEAEGEPCWSAPLLRDPVCTSKSHPLSLSIRGTDVAESAARASDRTFNPVVTLNEGSPQIGFRCARAASP